MTPEQRKNIEDTTNELSRLSRKVVATASKLSEVAGFTFVDTGELALLRSLRARLSEAMKTLKMTRDYADVRSESFPYLGKKYLMGRSEGGEVFRVMDELDSQYPRKGGA